MKKEVTLSFTLTPDELADGFAELDAVDQARFFYALHDISRHWPAGGCMQFYAIGKAIRERTLFGGDSVIKDILDGFNSVGDEEAMPPKKEDTYRIGDAWRRLSEDERDAVLDYAMDIVRAKE